MACPATGLNFGLMAQLAGKWIFITYTYYTICTNTFKYPPLALGSNLRLINKDEGESPRE